MCVASCLWFVVCCVCVDCCMLLLFVCVAWLRVLCCLLHVADCWLQIGGCWLVVVRVLRFFCFWYCSFCVCSLFVLVRDACWLFVAWCGCLCVVHVLLLVAVVGCCSLLLVVR